MKHRISSIFRGARRFCRERRGVSTVVFAVSAIGIMGMAGMALDVGMVYTARNALQANTNAAVLAAAQNWGSSTGTVSSAETIAQNWHSTYPVPNVAITSAIASSACVTTTTNLPNCSSSAPNVIQLTQKGTVNTHFFPFFGVTSTNIAATAAAAKAGGASIPLNVMFVLDATASMGSGSGGCSVPGVSSPTPFQCATNGIQVIMKQLLPQQDRVGIMQFPGLASPFSPTTAESSCATYPSSTPYYSSTIYYQYEPNGTAALDPAAGWTTSSGTVSYNNGSLTSATLTDTDPLVEAVGDYSNSKQPCAKPNGGQGTYYGEMLTLAQAALQAQGTAKVQNVIIILSDGGSNATSSNFASGYQTATYIANQCATAVYAAQQATKAGTWVYSIAYNSATTACPSYTLSKGGSITDTFATGVTYPVGTQQTGTAMTPCLTMQMIASDPTKFFTTSSACTESSSPNSYTDVTTAFQQVGTTLNKPRLVTTTTTTN